MPLLCVVVRRSWALIAGGILLVAASQPARAQDAYTFDWRVIGTVQRSTEGSDRQSTTRHQLNGTGTLTLVRDPTPDARFAFHFEGPEGSGSGLVPRAAEQALDPITAGEQLTSAQYSSRPRHGVEPARAGRDRRAVGKDCWRPGARRRHRRHQRFGERAVAGDTPSRRQRRIDVAMRAEHSGRQSGE